MLSLSDVYIALFTLIFILLSLPAFLVALNLLLPKSTGAAYARLKQTPVKCFFAGIPITFGLLLIIAILANIPGPGQGMAFVIAFIGMGFGSIGGGGLSRLLGERIARLSAPNSAMTSWVRGAVLFEFACLLPIVGWFLFIPIAGITLLGASSFALIGWLPKAKVVVNGNAVQA